MHNPPALTRIAIALAVGAVNFVCLGFVAMCIVWLVAATVALAGGDIGWNPWSVVLAAACYAGIMGTIRDLLKV